MKQPILFVDQTGCWGGAQHVLEIAISALEPEFIPIVALPEDGAFANELRRKRVETRNLPLGTYRSGKKSLTDMAAFALRNVVCAAQLVEAIRRRNVKLVYINGPRCLPGAVWAARWTDVPSLFHVHLTMTRASEKLVMALATPHATEIVACCQAAAAPLLQVCPALQRKLHVVYNPVRPLVSGSVSGAERSASATVLKSSPRPVIGLVGRISPQKRQHILLQAAARLKNRGIDAQIVLLGVPREDSMEDAAYARSLRSSAQLLGLEADVEWTGYQTDPNPYYAMIDVLVMPSTASEGLPLAALEALQWGIPVVASPIGGIPELISHGVNGLIVPPLDDQALAEALEQILTDPALRSRLQLGARATIGSRFSVATFTASIREIVLRLCETHQSEAKPERADQVAARV